MEKGLKEFVKKKKNIEISLQYILNKLSFGALYNSNEVKLLNEANMLIKNDLDIFVILDRLKELEKFKNLFLT